jgi:hypothetical protein
MGRKIAKLPRCPQATVSAKSNHLKNDSANDVHSFKNWTGDQTGEAVGLGFYRSDHWFNIWFFKI